jgi:hypothetical protein
MTSVKIDTKYAPYPAMLEALRLIEESGFPRHEKIVDAAAVLRIAMKQLEYASPDVRQACGGPL